MEELSLADYLAILRWRKKYFFLTFSLLWSISLVFALCWSNYRSTATVEIEQAQIAPDMTTPMGMNPNGPEALADLRISKIQQKVTAPSSLIDIILKYDLYPDSRQVEPIASTAGRMQNKFHLALIGSTVANPAATEKVSVTQLSAIAFTLSFDYSNPHLAQQVTNELVTRFLDEDLKQRHAQAEATSEFLATQITALEASLADQEKKIAEFQKEHGAARPEALMFNQQAAETTFLSLQGLDSQISANEGTQGQMRGQLAVVDPYSRVIADGQVLTTPAIQLKALEAQYTTLTAQYGPDYPDVIKIRHQIDALRGQTGIRSKGTGQIKAQIEDLSTNLAAAEHTYGPDSPDVISLRHQLEKLEKELTTASAGGLTGEEALKKDADNPAYLQLVAQLRSAEEQHKSLVEQREKLRAQQSKYQAAVAQNPMLEQEMARLSRDYENAQLRYRDLKEKKMAADMDEQMIQDRKGQRLNVISPPDLPTKTHPSRLLIIIAGFILSVLGGIGTVILVQAINRNILGSQHLAAIVGVSPLVTVPHIYTQREAARVRRRKPMIVATSLFLATATILVIHFAVMPVDVLWIVFTQRLGLS